MFQVFGEYKVKNNLTDWVLFFWGRRWLNGRRSHYPTLTLLVAPEGFLWDLDLNGKVIMSYITLWDDSVTSALLWNTRTKAISSSTSIWLKWPEHWGHLVCCWNSVTWVTLITNFTSLLQLVLETATNIRPCDKSPNVPGEMWKSGVFLASLYSQWPIHRQILKNLKMRNTIQLSHHTLDIAPFCFWGHLQMAIFTLVWVLQADPTCSHQDSNIPMFCHVPLESYPNLWSSRLCNQLTCKSPPH